MWGQIPAMFAENLVAQTSKKRLRAKNLLGNHPGKRAHIQRKMETPRLAMRMGAVLEDEVCHEDFSIGIGRRVFISGNKRTIILFRETGVPELNLDRELQLAAINYPV